MEHLTVSCANCGGSTDVRLKSDGTVLDGHYATVIVGHHTRIVDGATIVDGYLDEDVRDGHHAVVYTECQDCCSYCDDGAH